ncbi:MAG: hypothetical protein II943_11835 [Victivallales bacterium]|nr:hypothetical protein [Victivallales bacterium]
MDTPNKKQTDLERETQAYLAKIRRTINESEALMAQVELRRAETDRLLASQGLTREQVEAMNFTDEQLSAVNEELRRRGLAPLADEWFRPAPPASQGGQAAEPNFEVPDSQGDLENRRRKFSNMMRDFRL